MTVLEKNFTAELSDEPVFVHLRRQKQSNAVQCPCLRVPASLSGF